MADDLTVMRDRLAEALTREHYRRADERIEASVEEHCAAFADAVLPVVAAKLAAARGEAREQTQRAEHAEAEVERLRNLHASQLRLARAGHNVTRRRAEKAEAVTKQAREILPYFAGQIEGLRSKHPIVADAFQFTYLKLRAALDGQARTITDNGGHCQGCADSLAACRAGGGRCCDLCQHPPTTGPKPNTPADFAAWLGEHAPEAAAPRLPAPEGDDRG